MEPEDEEVSLFLHFIEDISDHGQHNNEIIQLIMKVEERGYKLTPEELETSIDRLERESDSRHVILLFSHHIYYIYANILYQDIIYDIYIDIIEWNIVYENINEL
jgi:hypothetical protein